MSSAPTDCRVPDPSDRLNAKADGQFQQVNRRAGYGDDRLERTIATARKGWTLAAGEGLALVQEIDRLRTGVDLLKAQYEDAWKVGMEAVEKMRRLEEENNRLRKDFEIATSMLGDQVPLLNRLQDENDWLRKELDEARADVERRWDDIIAAAKKIEKLQNELAQQTITLSAEHQRAERILAALREPSDFVIEAVDATAWEQGCARLGLPACALVARAAVAAAEREVGA